MSVASKVAIAFALGAACVAAPASASELVTNGGFETGDFTGWTQYGNTGFTGPSTYSQSGAYSAEFGPVGSIGGISQTLATVAGETYDYSFWVDINGGGVNSFEAVFDGTQLAFLNADTNGWVQLSGSVVAGGNSALLDFAFRNDPSWTYLDNVSFVARSSAGAVPEPGTWAMMLIGFGAVGFSMRRARRAKVVPAFA